MRNRLLPILAVMAVLALTGCSSQAEGADSTRFGYEQESVTSAATATPEVKTVEVKVLPPVLGGGVIFDISGIKSGLGMDTISHIYALNNSTEAEWTGYDDTGYIPIRSLKITTVRWQGASPEAYTDDDFDNLFRNTGLTIKGKNIEEHEGSDRIGFADLASYDGQECYMACSPNIDGYSVTVSYTRSDSVPVSDAEKSVVNGIIRGCTRLEDGKAFENDDSVLLAEMKDETYLMEQGDRYYDFAYTADRMLMMSQASLIKECNAGSYTDGSGMVHYTLEIEPILFDMKVFISSTSRDFSWNTDMDSNIAHAGEKTTIDIPSSEIESLMGKVLISSEDEAPTAAWHLLVQQ